jgi:type IV pilus assembly protein PilW
MKMITRSFGYSLLEFLLANVLAVIVIAGVFISYLSITNISHFQQNREDMQSSIRFATQILSERIRLAGFIGCAQAEQPVLQDQAIQGYDSDHAPSEFNEKPVSGTDAVVINSCVSNTYIFKNSALTKMMYYIGDTNRKNSAGQKIYALFQKPLNNERLELVTGVDNMQLTYGVLASDTTIAYYTAAQILDWQKVVSVNMNLLFHSEEPVLRVSQPWNIYVTLRERA